MNIPPEVLAKVMAHGLLWSIEEQRAEGYLAMIVSADRTEPEAVSHPYVVEDGIAHFVLEGPVTRKPSSHQSFFGGYSSTLLRRSLMNADRDKSVSGIMLSIDSPGGEATGIPALAQTIRDLKKPVVAYVDGLAASAAYWIASQADEIVASPMSEVGNIGCYAVINDTSEMYRKDGVKVNVVRSGPYKGVGVRGSEVTEDHLSDIQRQVDTIHAAFVGSVREGRAMSENRANDLSDGRIFFSEEAKGHNLIDRIGDEQDACKALNRLIRKESGMANKTLRDKIAAVLGRSSDGDTENAEDPTANILGELVADSERKDAEIASLRAAVTEREQAVAVARQAESLKAIDSMIDAGKLLPAQRESALALKQASPEAFDHFMASAAPVRAVGTPGVNAGEAARVLATGGEAALTELRNRTRKLAAKN